jgi:hypothetical protein
MSHRHSSPTRIHATCKALFESGSSSALIDFHRVTGRGLIAGVPFLLDPSDSQSGSGCTRPVFPKDPAVCRMLRPGQSLCVRGGGAGPDRGTQGLGFIFAPTPPCVAPHLPGGGV